MDLQNARAKLHEIADGHDEQTTLEGFLTAIDWHGPQLNRASQRVVATVVAEMTDELSRTPRNQTLRDERWRTALGSLYRVLGLRDGRNLDWGSVGDLFATSNEVVATVFVVDEALNENGEVAQRLRDSPEGTRSALREVALTKLRAIDDERWKAYRFAASLLAAWARFDPDDLQPRAVVERLLGSGDPELGPFVDSFVNVESSAGGRTYRFGEFEWKLYDCTPFLRELRELKTKGGVLSDQAIEALDRTWDALIWAEKRLAERILGRLAA